MDPQRPPTTRSTTLASVKPQTPPGGVAFDKPTKPAPEGPTKDITQEEVKQELSVAGIKPENDGAPSWLTEKKSSLTEKPAPPISPKPVTPPQTSSKPTTNAERLAKTSVDGIVPLRTYKDDIARAIERNRLSKTDVSVAEQERRLKRLDEERAELELKKKLEEDTLRLKKLERNVSRVAKPADATKAEPTKTKEETLPPAAPTTAHPSGEEEEVITHPVTMVPKPGPVPPPKPTPPPPALTREMLETSIQQTKEELAQHTTLREETSPVQVDIPSKFPRSIMISLLLLLCGGALLGGTWYVLQERAPSLEPLVTESLIFAETSQEVPIETVLGQDLVGLLSVRVKESPVAHNTITYLKTTLPEGERGRRVATTQEWFERLSGSADPALVRAFAPTFMLGVYGGDRNEPFLILKTAFYENAFAGMLTWEKTMGNDLAPLFGSTLSMRAHENPQSPSGSFFSDEIINNKDTRALRNLDGEIELMYSFVDRETLVITTNKTTFLEILARLNATRTKR